MNVLYLLNGFFIVGIDFDYWESIKVIFFFAEIPVSRLQTENCVDDLAMSPMINSFISTSILKIFYSVLYC